MPAETVEKENEGFQPAFIAVGLIVVVVVAVTREVRNLEDQLAALLFDGIFQFFPILANKEHIVFDVSTLNGQFKRWL